MRLGKLGRVLAVFGLLTVPLVVVPTVGRAAQGPAAKVSETLVLSNFEAHGRRIVRDAGYSAVEPGTRNSLWLFGDSGWGCGLCVWLGTTAAVGPFAAGVVPSRLTEIPTRGAINAPNSRAPQGFSPAFPGGGGLLLPGGKHACTKANGGTAVAWPSGVAAEPAGGKVLIIYAKVCETATDTVERFSVAQYDPRRNIRSGLTDVFKDTAGRSLPPQEYLGSPIFAGPFLYLFGSEPGRVFVARVPANPANWQSLAAYRWWDGSTWVSDYKRAASIIHGAGAAPVALAYAGDFSAETRPHHRLFVIVTQTDFSGRFRVWQATSLTGPWTGKAGMEPCTSGHTLKNLCRAYIGHPELSTSSRVMLSFFNPADQHVVALEVPY